MVNKISKSRYKSYGQKQRFTRRGSELTRQIDEIRRQREIEISGLRALADNEQRNDELYIRGLQRKGATELENKQQIHKFERDATSNALGALGVAAEGEIRALQGQAEEAGKWRDFWKDFAVNHSQKYAKLAEGAAKLIDEKRSIHLLNKLDPEFAYKAAENFTKGIKIVEKNALKEVGATKGKKGQILDPVTKKEVIVDSSRGVIHYHNKMVQDVKQGRAFYTSLLERIAKDETGKSLLTPSMAQNAYVSYSYELLKELKIDPSSKAGREITRQFAVWGRDVAESRWNQHQAQEDLGNIQKKSETLASEIKLALEATEPGKEQEELWNNAQITFQGLHHIINGSIYESTDGKFGLRSWNPQTLNAEVIKQVYPFLREMSYDELYTVFNKLKIFDETTAEKIKVKGQEVGILDKSKTNQEALLDLVIANADFRKKETAAKRDGQLKRLILPYDEAWEAAKKDKSKMAEFNKMIPSYISLVSSSKFKDTDYRTTAWERTKYNPAEYGSYQTYEKMLELVIDGDLEEAMILIASTAGTGEVQEAYGSLAHNEFGKLHTAINVINNLSWHNSTDVGAIQEAATDIYKKSMNAAFKDRTLNVDDKKVIKALRQHIIREIVNDKSEDTPDQVFQRAIETVDKAFDIGIKEQKGVYAATEASVSNWTIAEVDERTGKVTKPGGYGKKTKDSIRPDNLNNYIFHGFDDRIDHRVTQTLGFFNEEFIQAKEGSTKLTKVRLRENIQKNLNSPNSILTTDEKNFISMQVLGLEDIRDNRAISSNLKVLITMAKKYNNDITTKDVMNMVVDGLSANKELYGQLEGKTYPMGFDDITKKLTGKCAKNAKNNLSLCIAGLFKKAGVEVNEQLGKISIKNPTVDQYLELYAEPKQ